MPLCSRAVVAESVPVFSVANLWEMIEGRLEPLMTSRFRLRGTIQDVAVRKHLYCSLADRTLGTTSAKINSVIFATDYARIRTELAHRGLGDLTSDVEVVALGRLSTYRPGGRVSFVVEQLDYEEMRRLGQEDIDRLRATLIKEGVFDANRRRPLSEVPLNVAIVTSSAGTVQHDFTRVLARSGFAFAWQLYSAPVTGTQVADELARMLRQADAGAHDLVVLLRGGGSESELALFNTEPVVRAVVDATTPIWCAIGHAADQVLVNEVAHRALDVPQSVAAALVERVSEFLDEFKSIVSRVLDEIEMWLGSQRLIRQTLASRVIGVCHSGLTQMQVAQAEQWATLSRHGERRCRQESGDVHTITRGVRGALQLRLAYEMPQVAAFVDVSKGVGRRLEAEARAIERHRIHLAVQDPASQLERGFAILQGSQGQWLMTMAQVLAESRVTAMLADGSVALQRPEGGRVS